MMGVNDIKSGHMYELKDKSVYRVVSVERGCPEIDRGCVTCRKLKKGDGLTWRRAWSKYYQKDLIDFCDSIVRRVGPSEIGLNAVPDENANPPDWRTAHQRLTQDMHSCGSTAGDEAEVSLEACDAGAGPYVVLQANEWAMSNEQEIDNLTDRMKQMLREWENRNA